MKKRITNRMKRECIGKIQHKSFSSAEYVLHNMNYSRYEMNVYKCKFCGFYHVGRIVSH